ncbi:lysophospholipid acyltransferase family protein [Vibrio misgurnus]|uniref:lysophospholipid acyltransferase family protein n=1 Tax=Vibrio misgurnus TaxID=2993714 RepID=UPI002416BBC6|nr:GNAT family N-acyltransferase [Vibrio sp. gvc]
MLARSPFILPRKTPFGVGEHLVEWATGLKRLNHFYAQRPVNADPREFLRFSLEALGIDYHVIRGERTNIPSHGATLVVANHPLGCVEGVILAELLLSVRSDVKILANQYLTQVPELAPLFIGVDVFATTDAACANLHALRQAHKHLDQGGVLLMFPAGEVSQLVDSKQGRLEDKEWSQSVSRLVKKHHAHTVPIYIDGHNSTPFYLAGKIHPLLRTLMLGRELLNKQHTQINIAIGEAITYHEVQHLCDQQLVNYLRLNTYLLKHSPVRNKTESDHSLPAVAPRLPIEDLLEDIAQLPYADHMLRHNQFDVYCTKAENIPALMHEIGRIRELNFRAVGEGTGQTLDIDLFDRDYWHLFIWDREQQQLVGAYRLGLVDQLLHHKGIEGLYSRTLFHYDQRFLSNMGNAIEMGRSVIDGHYQKSMTALLLLWKGIGTYISRHPHYTHLFGPVSISNDYSEQARRLLTDTMTLHYYDAEQAQLVIASNPLPIGQAQWNANLLSSLADLQLLSRVIARIDEGKGVPVLLRQYLGLNGKLVSFNVDPAFNNALDGLIVVDLRNVPHKTLARYMGQQQAKDYQITHQYFSEI